MSGKIYKFTIGTGFLARKAASRNLVREESPDFIIPWSTSARVCLQYGCTTNLVAWVVEASPERGDYVSKESMKKQLQPRKQASLIQVVRTKRQVF